jgi:hypothetical protein
LFNPTFSENVVANFVTTKGKKQALTGLNGIKREAGNTYKSNT